jgi:hypothetical protein
MSRLLRNLPAACFRPLHVLHLLCICRVLVTATALCRSLMGRCEFALARTCVPSWLCKPASYSVTASALTVVFVVLLLLLQKLLHEAAASIHGY